MSERVIVLAGNPNVGKSTIFNALTGLRQHTGNWPGKTVSNAQGRFSHNGHDYLLTDAPGCYSLLAHSQEEEVARDCICFEHPDAVIVVCDATCLERNMNLVLQVIEATNIEDALGHVIVCVNLMDEAQRRHIRVDAAELARRLGVPVVATSARNKRGLSELLDALDDTTGENVDFSDVRAPCRVMYAAYIERAISRLMPAVRDAYTGSTPIRWLCARLLDADESLRTSMRKYLGADLFADERIAEELSSVHADMSESGISPQRLRDDMAATYINEAERICSAEENCDSISGTHASNRLDGLFTSRLTGFPIMFLLLTLVLWITITGANYPSALLSEWLTGLESWLYGVLERAGMPEWSNGLIVHGAYRVMAWVISVMLPPMAIFFPMFTLLEDFGYLPRVAFNLDRCFHWCSACGKQALTMLMGFGCNAVGVTGCRIIDSPRERLIAILTNSLVPCNGRFPTLITLIPLLMLGTGLDAALLAGVIVLGVAVTLLCSKLLSKTVLRGTATSFTLELPPYRRPQVGKVIVRSVLDRTLRVLGRAVVAAAPAGVVIWLLANLRIGDATLLARCSGLLDPFARQLGLDGVILLAFILGLPANEIVLPVIAMTYMAQGTLVATGDAGMLRQLLISNGWTWLTALNTILFSLLHWPCATTCLTIHRETGSLKWTLLAMALPTACGMTLCHLTAKIAMLW